ncbi:Uncharacterized protein involved in outer membrane biogenesis [Oceanospirillum multiglobuliferum]|uniref:AsmA domain-containing protein n=1 Tax=Oceanospirillum multiglobuliferum TaxID=64969 RepID=A0A1T4NJL8_9GAMM|nr:AsmA family protein [Oceanospirillum multiglobuliferum]OPX55779.1 hypothetical protein BTE48_07800 [Oceanospirillum multiglobuliferum]SJZ79454.1 Uncharacterized protein involved in outer membrane biogenesis [Oceanospirillum multiglobuliferum]
MRLLIKSIVYLLLGITALLVAAGVYLTQFFDANSYKSLIIEQADKAGVPLELNGDLKVTVFPWLGANINGVKVLHPITKNSQQPFAALNTLSVQLKVLPLLKGEIAVDRVILDGLSAAIEIDKNGVGNWQVFIPKADSTTSNSAPADAKTDTTQASAAQAPLLLAVAGIDITNTKLSFVDHQQNLSATIKQFELHSSDIALGKSFPLNIKADIETKNPDLNTQIDLSSLVFADLGKQLYQLTNIQLNVAAKTPLIGSQTVNVSLKTNVKADMNSQQINISQLAFQLRNLALEAKNLPEVQANLDMALANADLNLKSQAYKADNLSLKLFARTPLLGPDPVNVDLSTSATAMLNSGDVQISTLKLNVQNAHYVQQGGLDVLANLDLNSAASLNLKQQTYDLSKLLVKGDIKTDLLGANALPFQLNSSASANLKQQTAELKPTQLSLDNITITLQALASQLDKQPEVNAAIKIDEFSPRDWLNRLKIALPEMADSSTLGSLSLISRVSLAGDNAKIYDLSLKADQTTVTGQAGINLKSQAMFAAFDIDSLNADRYLPTPVEATDTKEAEKPAPTEETDLIPVELLKPIQAKAQINVGQLTIKKHLISDIKLDLDANKGLISLHAADAALYEGTVKNQAKLDLNQTPIQIQFSHQTKGLSIYPLLQTAAEIDKVRGATYLNANFKTQTNRLSTIMANLNGAARFDVQNGAFIGTNLSKELCSALSGDAKNTIWSADTEFSSLKGDINFVNGVGNNKNMTVAIPGILTTGFGEVDLPKSNFKYNLGAQITDASNTVCTVKDRFEAVRWPVACSGHYGEPFAISCGLDYKAIGGTIAGMAKAEATAAFNAEKARLQAEAEARLAAEKAALNQRIADEKAAAKKQVEDAARKKLEDAVKKLF